MLVIDGAHLEGGGQIIRAAVALSALTGKPMKLVHIRAGRQQPGLRPQHLTAVRAVAAASDAEVLGCIPGSQEIIFLPGQISSREITLDVGTAGSIPLVIQAWLPVALHTGGTLALTGGTDVERSPTIDYLVNVLLPFLENHGARVSVTVTRRGFYPRGGGLVAVNVKPSVMLPLSAVSRQTGEDRGICSCSAGLPAHVAERQAQAARTLLFRNTGLDFPAAIDVRPGPGTGSSCIAWMGWKGGTGLGRKGYPAEKVGEDAALALIREVDGGGQVDSFMADQLLIYLAMAGGSYTSNSCTLHARTMCWLLHQFGFHIRVSRENTVRFERAAGA